VEKIQNDSFIKKVAFTVIVLLIAMNIIPSSGTIVEKQSTILTSNGDILYVGGSGSGNYTKIQDAIDNASDGDTVFVYDNSSPYYENVIVDVSINLIGEYSNTTIIDGSKSGNVVNIASDNTNISGFTIQNSGSFDDGINIRSNYNTIKGNNIIWNGYLGIYLLDSHDNIISGNTILNNFDGIYLDDSSNNTIISNNISYNKNWGIELSVSHCNNISNNIIHSHLGNIELFLSNKNTINNNIISNAYHRGVVLQFSNNNIISRNNISSTKFIGIVVVSRDNKIIQNNFIKNKIHACFAFFSFPILINYNKWDGNYWDNWIGLEHPLLSKFPKIIVGALTRANLLKIPCFNFDWRPAQEPYDIS